MGCGVYWSQINQLNQALRTMQNFGIGPGDLGYNKLFSLRGKLMKQVGFKFPRTVTQILKLAALSPGSITVWNDAEAGWMIEARERPGAPPVYRYVSDLVAMTVLKGELTPELEKELMTPDDYYGE